MKKLSALILTICFSLCGTLSVFATDMFPNPDSRATYLYDFPEEQSPVQLKAGEELGMYLWFDKPISELHFSCPSWSNNIGSMTLKIYKWKKDYATTVKTQPIAQETFVDYEDNAWLIHKAKSGSYPEGEYLWVLCDSVENVGIWKGNFDNMDTPIIVESYKNGTPIQGIYTVAVVYADADAIDTSATTPSPAPAVTTISDTENVIMYVDSNKAFVKGVETALDVPATVINGRTLVPARFVSESLGATVFWDEPTQTVVIEKGDTVVALVIGSTEMRINGESTFLDVAADTINGRTLVPLRAIAEALGQQVNYFPDGDKGLIVVGANATTFESSKASDIISTYK